MRHIRDVVNHDAKRNNDVKACHEGNHPFSDAGNTSHAAADDSHGKNCNNSSDDHTVSTKCMVQRKGNSIGLDGVVNHAVSNGNEDGKDSCPEFVAQTIFQVVSRTASETISVFTRNLVNLSQGTFYKSCSRTDDSNEPHPENSSRTAGYNSNCNAGNIAYADSGCCTDAERLERRNFISFCFCAGRICYQFEHRAEIAKLYCFCADGKVHACAYQKDNDD